MTEPLSIEIMRLSRETQNAEIATMRPMKDALYSHAWFQAQFLQTATSQAELYHVLREALGLSRDKVNKMVNGKRNPQPNELPLIWKFFDIKHEQINALVEMDRQAERQREHDEELAKPLVTPDVAIGEVKNFPSIGPRDLPLMQTAQGGEDGDLIMTDQIMDYIRRPASLEGQRVFAAYVAGDSMAPRYEAGDPVYAYYSRPVAPGDYVILEVRPEDGSAERRGFIKKLVRRRAAVWECEQFNPKGPIVFPVDRVIKVYRVVPPKELYG